MFVFVCFPVTLTLTCRWFFWMALYLTKPFHNIAPSALGCFSTNLYWNLLSVEEHTWNILCSRNKNKNDVILPDMSISESSYFLKTLVLLIPLTKDYSENIHFVCPRPFFADVRTLPKSILTLCNNYTFWRNSDFIMSSQWHQNQNIALDEFPRYYLFYSFFI